MRAVVSRMPGDLVLENTREPKPGLGQAVLHVPACGICGSDLGVPAAFAANATPQGQAKVLACPAL